MNIKLLFLFISSLFVACKQLPRTLNANEVYNSTVLKTVTIVTENSLGSGFFVDSDKVVTNYHVIEGSSRASIIVNSSSTRFPVTGYVSLDLSNDLILLQVEFKSDSWVTIEKKVPQIGEKVFAIGSPVGLPKTISEGIVSGLRKLNNKQLLQITTPISPGSSGCPILNEAGYLVGVAVGGIEQGNNIGFCIPSSLVRGLIDFKDSYSKSLSDLQSSDLNNIVQKVENSPKDSPPVSDPSTSTINSSSSDFQQADEKSNKSESLRKVEAEASFPGGESIWLQYIQRNANGQVANDNGAPEGTYTVVVQFVVDKEGNISDVRSLTKHGYGMEEEAIRVIRNAPRWEPAVQNGRYVKAYRRQPITFRVEPD